jgi:hypothetical protein
MKKNLKLSLVSLSFAFSLAVFSTCEGPAGQDGKVKDGTMFMPNVVHNLDGLKAALIEGGNVYLVSNITIPKGETLTVPDGSNLFITIPEDIRNRAVVSESTVFTLEGNVSVQPEAKLWFAENTKLSGSGSADIDGDLVISNFNDLSGHKFTGDGMIKFGNYKDSDTIVELGTAESVGSVKSGNFATSPALNENETYIWTGTNHSVTQVLVTNVGSGRLIVQGSASISESITVGSKKITFNTLNVGYDANLNSSDVKITNLNASDTVEVTLPSNIKLKTASSVAGKTLTINCNTLSIGKVDGAVAFKNTASIEIGDVNGTINLPNNWSAGNVSFTGAGIVNFGTGPLTITGALKLKGVTANIPSGSNVVIGSTKELFIDKQLNIEGTLTLENNSIVNLSGKINVKNDGVLRDNKQGGGSVWASGSTGLIVFEYGSSAYVVDACTVGTETSNAVMIKLSTGASMALGKDSIEALNSGAVEISGEHVIGNSGDIKTLKLTGALKLVNAHIELADGAVLTGANPIFGTNSSSIITVTGSPVINQASINNGLTGSGPWNWSTATNRWQQ